MKKFVKMIGTLLAATMGSSLLLSGGVALAAPAKGIPVRVAAYSNIAAAEISKAAALKAMMARDYKR